MKLVLIFLAIIALNRSFAVARLSPSDCSAIYHPKINNVSLTLQSDLNDCEMDRNSTIDNSLGMLQDKKDENDSKISEITEYLDDCSQRDDHYDAVKCYSDFNGNYVVIQTSMESKMALKQHEMNMNMVDMIYTNCQFTASSNANMETQKLFNDYNYCVVKGEIPKSPEKSSSRFM